MGGVFEGAPELGTGEANAARQVIAAPLADPIPEQPRFFNFDAQAVRVVGDPDSPRFIAKDICDALGIQNPRDTVRKVLDDDEKGVAIVYTLGGPQQLATVNESGLYALIFRSRKPQAKVFRRWVTGEVLPAIRRTGGYGQPPPPDPAVTKLTAEVADLVSLLRAAPAGRTKRQAVSPLAVPAEAVVDVFRSGPLGFEAALRAILGSYGYVPRATFYRRLLLLADLGALRRRPDATWELADGGKGGAA